MMQPRATEIPLDGPAIPGVAGPFVKDAIAQLASQTFQSADAHNILNDIPSSEWAGIKAGTSTYDCTTVIRNAILIKIKLYFPSGRYPISDTISTLRDTVIYGTGGCEDSPPDYSTQSWLFATTSSAKLNIPSATGGVNPDNVRLHSIHVDANNLAPFCIVYGFTNRCYTFDVSVRNATDTGFCVSSTQNSMWQHCNAVSCPRGYGLYNGAQNNYFYSCFNQGHYNNANSNGNGLGQTTTTGYAWRHVLVAYRTDTPLFPGDAVGDTQHTFRCSGNHFLNAVADYGGGIYGVELAEAGSDTRFTNWDISSTSVYSAGTPLVGGSGLSPEPAGLYIADGATCVLDGQVQGNNNNNTLIENHGLLILGSEAEAAHPNAGFFPHNIRNFGTIRFGTLHTVEEPNMLRPEFSYFGGNTAWYSAVKVGIGVNPADSYTTVTFDTVRQKVNATFSATNGGYMTVLFDNKGTLHQIAQGTVYKIKVHISSIAGGLGKVTLQEFYIDNNNATTTSDIAFVEAGAYEFLILPTYTTPTGGVLSNFFRGVGFKVTPGDATAMVLDYVTIQNVGRAGA